LRPPRADFENWDNSLDNPSERRRLTMFNDPSITSNCACSDPNVLLPPTTCDILANDARDELATVRRNHAIARNAAITAPADSVSFDRMGSTAPPIISGATRAKRGEVETDCDTVPSLSQVGRGSGPIIEEADVFGLADEPEDEDESDEDGDDDDAAFVPELERNAIGTRTREPFGTRSTDLDDRDAELRDRLGLGDGDEDEEDRSFPHGYEATHNKSMPGHLRLAERKEVQAAFAAMRDAGGRESADARRATATAADSGRARDHRAAAEAHRDAAEHHEYEGNDEHAENHRVAAKYHSRMARKATRNDSAPGHLRLAERREVQAAFAEMARQGGRPSAEARAATKKARESGRATDHKKAAAAHRIARDFHRDEGNEDKADEHQAASRYHEKMAYHAGKRAARKVLNMASSASRKAVRIGTESAHSDAAEVNRIAAATATVAGDTVMAQVYATDARKHDMMVANMRAARDSLTRNIGPAGDTLPIYMGRGVIPPEFTGRYDGLTANVAGPGGVCPDDYLPVPVMNYAESCSPALRQQHTAPVANVDTPAYSGGPGGWPLPLPQTFGPYPW
jgi:hypothetical protein